ncbi:major histocompatibility complex class I-related gene protein-like [Pantherophis guttatus]|uniref:Major histocompatibility complex class I-related gene protein-like n=1 Tax=Pantherophis guttatus TaxID=94885 RepID=A0A6P9CFA7_PANGU|nr:major histocompatibility complex class I-related gene protein-like [Pantherophis guttatus]XP_034277947.1 major histocompatibility complex class I-related gene protein-like [Pantherophis guttatus]
MELWLELLALLLLGGSSGSFRHSLRYQYLVVSEPSEGLPQFITVGFVDNQIITYYDSQKKKKVPKVSWMKEVEKEDPTYWKEGSDILSLTQEVLQEDLRHVQNRYKQTRGFHTWQTSYGCELQGNRSKGGYSEYGYDGKTFLTFDKETLSWVAPDPLAEITKRKWDNNVRWSQRNKIYLEKECIEWLKKYLSYREKAMLPSTESPVVTMSSRTEAEDGMETHVCRVHGFYPREIDASWKRDGEVWLQDTLHGSVAPNADGTYHYWLSIQIDPKERDRYRCHVEHDSLQEPLDMAMKELTNSKANLGLIIVGIMAALVLVGVIAVILLVFFKKREDGYNAARKSDKGSNSSDWASDKGSNSSDWGRNMAI